VVEATPLLSACDAVLTRSDGVSFLMVCVVDAERDTSRRFGLDKAALHALAKACQDHYCAPVYGGVKTAVGIEILEVRQQVADADRARLAELRGASRSCVVSTYLLDTLARTVDGRSGALVDLGRRRRALAKLLQAPRLSEAELAPPPPEAPLQRERRRPTLTYGMLGLFAALYAVEVAVSRDPSSFTPDIDTLVSMGGVSRTLLDQGEWHRLLTAALLHASPLHILFNGIAFWIGGAFLEGLVGPAWLLVIFCTGAVGGSLMSAALNDPNVVSVGASGAIMGMFASGFVLTYRIPKSAGRGRIQSGLLRMLIPSLLPLIPSHGESIDYADHFGGTLAGVAVGTFLLLLWPRASNQPRFPGLARTLAAVGLALAVWGGVRVHELYPSYATGAQLIPREEIPEDDAAAAAKAPEFLAKYPRDPRSHLFQGLALLDKKQAPEAEAELRKALADPVILRTHFNVGLEVIIRSLLAQALLQQEKTGEAREAVQPVCHAGKGGSVPEELKPLELCGS
jgi:rhomboid protease GluP